MAEKRLALVLGNDAYVAVPSLQKAVNDANALEKKLSALGFEVIKGVNLTRRQTVQKIQDLATRISIGDKVVFFYAGHGVQIDRSNLLLATDIPATGGIEEEYVRFEGFDVQKILDMIRGRGAQTTIMILDACRNNPFKASKTTRAIGGLTRGLVPIRETRRGTFIMYSADEGQEAFDSLGADDNDANSVFTRNLLRNSWTIQIWKSPNWQKMCRSACSTRLKQKFKTKARPLFMWIACLENSFSMSAKKPMKNCSGAALKTTQIQLAFKVYLQVYPNGKFKSDANDKIQRFGALQNSADPSHDAWLGL